MLKKYRAPSPVWGKTNWWCPLLLWGGGTRYSQGGPSLIFGVFISILSFNKYNLPCSQSDFSRGGKSPLRGYFNAGGGLFHSFIFMSMLSGSQNICSCYILTYSTWHFIYFFISLSFGRTAFSYENYHLTKKLPPPHGLIESFGGLLTNNCD